MTNTWCDRNWHDGTCCPGSIRQWHLDRDLLPPEPHGLDTAAAGWEWADHTANWDAGSRLALQASHDRGDHSACNRNCEATL
jgi:hypothetical protein